jgi:eukaryotic-like serine/threonine-protein kinase
VAGAAYAPGEVVAGRYRVEAVVGEGAMGTVYRVVEVTSQRTSALKVLRAELTEHAVARERMSREMRALARVRHPNVVELRDVVAIGDTLAVELELVEGGTLATRLAGGPLRAEQATALLSLLLAGLEAIHAAGLVHRDLKPGNILLAADGSPKIADLGIARDPNAPLLTAPGTVLGTPEYMSPEQIRGVEIGPESDVYACGILLYEMLTAAVPFDARVERDVLAAHLNQVPDLSRLPRDLPGALRATVAVALEKLPERRWRTARAMREALVKQPSLAGSSTLQATRYGEYTVRRLVGEGGMGRVYEAEERLSQRRVALKVLRSDVARSEASRRLFLNEMAILAQLDHPNVVRSLACLEVEGELVLVLEYLSGQTLRERLRVMGRLGWSEAVDVTCHIATALHRAHSMTPPVVHRDLKPENVMLVDDGTVKVMDFGIAKVLDSVSRTMTLSIGTLEYMSPEQIDARTVDARSDLYALGLLLYEMLVGAPPFRAESQRELLNQQCTAPPPEFPDAVRRGLPRGVERLAFQLLEKSPEARPPTALAVLDALEPFAAAFSAAQPAPRRLAAATVPAAAETAPATGKLDPGPPPLPGSRHVPLHLAVLIVVVLSALAGAAAYLLRAVL